MLNKVMLIGRLGRDPEVRYTTAGAAMTTFSMATDESYKDAATGEYKKKTEWHNVVAWGKTGEVAAKSLHTGSLVFVEGKIQTRSYEDKKTGEKKYSTEVVAFTLRFLEPKSAGTPDTPPAGDSDEPF